MNNDQKNNAPSSSDAHVYNLTDFDSLVDAALSAAAEEVKDTPHPVPESDSHVEDEAPSELVGDHSKKTTISPLCTEYSGGLTSDEDESVYPVHNASEMPSFFSKRRFIPSRAYLLFLLAYSVTAIAVIVTLIIGAAQLVSLHELSRPESVIDEYLSALSENRLYNDIFKDVSENNTGFENEVLAADSIFEKLGADEDRKYMQVISDDGFLRYDVFVGESRLYRLVLGKKAEASAFKMSFWEIVDASFYDDAVLSCMKTYSISAPVNAKVRLNGVLLGDEYIVDRDYHFFIGSSWESETPEGARCVLYEVSGLFTEPTFTAEIEGESLGIYADDDGVYHAKYPVGWVRDYTVCVPNGAVVYINGILATAVSEQGKAPATAFENSDSGITDIYRIEGLFNVPTVTVRFGGKPLTEHTFENDVFTYAFTDDVYHKAEIIAPAGAIVSVNGVLLSTLNCESENVPLSEWVSLPFLINSYTPTELALTTSVKMPSFVRYTVTSLYSTPAVTVKVGDVECATATSGVSEDGMVSSFAYDAPMIGSQSDIESFAVSFAKTYIEYVTEGCYGIRDDIELRKNFYRNWTDYLSYLIPDTLCFDNALDSYSDVEYRPIAEVVSQSYSIQHSIRYSDDVRYCQITCTVQDSLDEEETTFIMNVVIVRHNNTFKIWTHDTIEA